MARRLADIYDRGGGRGQRFAEVAWPNVCVALRDIGWRSLESETPRKSEIVAFEKDAARQVATALSGLRNHTVVEAVLQGMILHGAAAGVLAAAALLLTLITLRVVEYVENIRKRD